MGEVQLVVPVQLFESVGGSQEDRGNVACAIMFYAPKKYQLICYNESSEGLVGATITSSNEHSLQFTLETSDFATFRDDDGKKWSILFSRAGDPEPFCAHLGVAFYAAAAQPSHSAVVCEFARGSKEKVLVLGDSAKTKFTAWAVKKSAVPKVENVVATNGDVAYTFTPVGSALGLTEDMKGFEASLIGLGEEGKRAVVVPGSMRQGPFGNTTIVFVVTLVRKFTSAESEAKPHQELVLIKPPPVPSANGNGTAQASPEPQAVNAAGVPPEHMMGVNKISANLVATLQQVKNLQDKVEGFQEDWKAVVNRPKPSTLTPAALQQNIKNLVMEHERVQDEMQRKEDLIKSLDERNTELTRRVDRAAEVAQQLMDEKKSTVTSCSDLKLDSDRQVMKLQEQITRTRSERDDVNRHLQTVKKLLDIADADNREVKGRVEVLQVALANAHQKLDAIDDQLGEERSRRKAFEAKASNVLGEVRSAEAEVHARDAQLGELDRKAESDRVHYAQLMEDERSRRAADTSTLRDEIVDELEQRENRYKAERVRVAEDHYARGQDEGKQVGRTNTRIDMEARVQELLLDVQRATTELDAYKSQVQQAQEEAMAVNKNYEAQIAEVKKDVDELTRAHTTAKFQLQSCLHRTKTAEDSLFLSFTTSVHRLTAPASPVHLQELLQAVHEGEPATYSFEKEGWAAAEASQKAARIGWMDDELTAQYEALLDKEYEGHVLAAAAAETLDAVKALWEQRLVAQQEAFFAEEGSARGDVHCDENNAWIDFVSWYADLTKERVDLETNETEYREVVECSEEASWVVFQDFIEELAQQRKEVEDAETTAREGLESQSDAEVDSFLGEIRAFMQTQADARQEVCDNEERARSGVETELLGDLDSFLGEMTAFIESQVDERKAVEDSECTARTELDGDLLGELAHLHEWVLGLQQQQTEERATLETEETAALDALGLEEAGDFRSTEEAWEHVLYAGLIEEQQAVVREETAARDPIPSEEDDEFNALIAPHDDERAAALEAQQQREAQEQLEAEQKAFLDEEAAARDAFVKEEATEWTEVDTSEQKERPQTRERAESAMEADYDPLGGLLGGGDAAPSPPKPKPAAKKAPVARPQFSDSEESDGGLRPAPVRPAAKKSVAMAPVRGNMFDSDSEDGLGAPAPAPAPRRAPAAPVSNAKLFDSDTE